VPPGKRLAAFSKWIPDYIHNTTPAIYASVWNTGKLAGWVFNQLLRDLVSEAPWDGQMHMNVYLYLTKEKYEGDRKKQRFISKHSCASGVLHVSAWPHTFIRKVWNHLPSWEENS
jgi:hypothetical protein